MAFTSPDSEAIRREIADRGIRDVGGMFDCKHSCFIRVKTLCTFIAK